MLYEKMFGECHAHLIMDGLNYKEAISIHKDHVNDEVIRKHLKAYGRLPRKKFEPFSKINSNCSVPSQKHLAE